MKRIVNTLLLVAIVGLALPGAIADDAPMREAAADPVLFASVPEPEPMCHDDDCQPGRSRTCNVTVCVTVEVRVSEGDCAYIPIGTPCTAYVEARAVASSLVGGSARLDGEDGTRRTCDLGLADRCEMWTGLIPYRTARGNMVCWSAYGSASDGIVYTTDTTAAKCYEAH